MEKTVLIGREYYSKAYTVIVISPFAGLWTLKIGPDNKQQIYDLPERKKETNKKGGFLRLLWRPQQVAKPHFEARS